MNSEKTNENIFDKLHCILFFRFLIFGLVDDSKFRVENDKQAGTDFEIIFIDIIRTPVKMTNWLFVVPKIP